MIATASTAEASERLSASPPLSSGLSRKSPTVAPRRSGEDERRPEQQHVAHLRREIDDRKDRQGRAEHQRATRIASPASAIQSPSAVPSVCEKVMVIQ